MRGGLIAVALALAVGTTAGIASGAASFKPRNGAYTGSYTSAEHEPGDVRLRVEKLRPGLHGVRLIGWSARLTCEDGSSSVVGPELTAARAGRTFSGYVQFADGDKSSFTGRFSSRKRLRGVAQVQTTGSSAAERCDTGKVRFSARRVGP
jgi:hypothetical protein